MGVETATCDRCGADADKGEDYDGRWWCQICWWKFAPYNDDSLSELKEKLAEAIKDAEKAEQKVRQVKNRIEKTEKIITKLEAKQ